VAPPRSEAATEDPSIDESREPDGGRHGAVTGTNASATGTRTRADASVLGANESTTGRVGAPAKQGNVGPRSEAGRGRQSDSVRGNNTRMDGTDADLTVGAPEFSDGPGSPRNESAVATYGTNVGTNIGPLRRVPVQGRSVARVARMLDACAELVDEIGYEELTTTLLAERAGVAIGSIYQFFPDKRAVVQALTLRNLEMYLARLSGRLSASTFIHWWDGVDAGIDEYIDLHRTVPGFRTLHFGNVVDVHLLDEERDNNAVIASALVGLLVADLDLQGGPNVEFAVMIAVEAADALIQLAFRRDPNGDPRVLAEAKSLIREYLQRQAA
jgi:AcrR family transcriptional regulator